MNICLKKLFIAIGYSETTWKAARTRAVGNNQTEVLEEKEAIKLIEKIASAKITKANSEKVTNAQKILGMKKWKAYATEVEVKKEEPCECEALRKRIKELEVENGVLSMLINMSGGEYEPIYTGIKPAES